MSFDFNFDDFQIRINVPDDDEEFTSTGEFDDDEYFEISPPSNSSFGYTYNDSFSIHSIPNMRNGYSGASDSTTHYLHSFNSNIYSCTWNQNDTTMATRLALSSTMDIYSRWVRNNLAHYLDIAKLPLCESYHSTSSFRGTRGALIEMIQCILSDDDYAEELWTYGSDFLEDALYALVNGMSIDDILDNESALPLVVRNHKYFCSIHGYPTNCVFVYSDRVEILLAPYSFNIYEDALYRYLEAENLYYKDFGMCNSVTYSRADLPLVLADIQHLRLISMLKHYTVIVIPSQYGLHILFSIYGFRSFHAKPPPIDSVMHCSRIYNVLALVTMLSSLFGHRPRPPEGSQARESYL